MNFTATCRRITFLPHTQQAESLLGSPMTYSLFEFAKEHAEELVVAETTAVPEAVRNQALFT